MPADLTYLWYPLLACLVLTGIHTYLGIHVIEREVIFVDLALAQIAALGATIALLVGGFQLGSGGAWFFSLGFTFLGAAVFAVTRMRHGRVPQEAIIGIVYAVASAASIVVVAESRDPHGAEHIRDLLAGNVLYVTPLLIAKTAALYLLIGVFHFVFRRRFLEISKDPEGAARRGRNLVFWDFLFYGTFGFVITSSVQIAGVLLVFSFLIVPSVFSMLFAKGLRSRLLIGWSLGAVVSFVGLLISYERPSGPVIVTLFGLTLLAAGIGRYVWLAKRRWVAAGWVAGAAAAVALVAVGGIALFGGDEFGHAHAHAVEHEHEDHEAHEPEPEVAPETAWAAEDLLDDESLLAALEDAETEEDRLRYAAALHRRARAEGADALRALTRSGNSAVREQAEELLR